MKNKKPVFILLVMIILDFVGFSLIFPLVPDLLIFYYTHPVYTLDVWILNIVKNIQEQISVYKIENIVLLMGTMMGSLYSLLQFFFSPFWGKLSDKIGRKEILVLTNLGIGLSYLVWFFSYSFIFFLISRILNGIMAGNLGVITAYLSDISDEKNRTHTMGLMGMSIGLGFIFGPILGGIFYFLGKLILNHFIELQNFLHPFFLCSLVSFILSMLSVFLAIFFLEKTKKTEVKKYNISFLSMDQNIKKIAILNFFYMLVFTSFEFTFTFFVKFKFLLNPTQIGFVFFYLGFFVALFQGVIPKVFAKKITEIQMIRWGTVFVSFSFLFIIITNYIYVSLICLLPLALGNSLVQPAVYSYSSKIAENQKGYILSFLRSMGSFARAISPLSGGALYWYFGYKITYILFFFICILIFFMSLNLKKSKEIQVFS